jgi:hypothetical protein
LSLILSLLFFLASCIAMVFLSFLSKQKEMDLLFGFSRYPPTYMMRKGQVAGSSCPFSFLCLYLIIPYSASMPVFYYFDMVSCLCFPSVDACYLTDDHLAWTLSSAMDLEIPIRLQKSVYRLVSERDAHVFTEGAIIKSTNTSRTQQHTRPQKKCCPSRTYDLQGRNDLFKTSPGFPKSYFR